MNHAYGITTFCDDIRFEQFGKLTLVGCYGSELLLHEQFPYLLPRLGIFVQLRFPPNQRSPSQIKIYFPENENEPAITMDIPTQTQEDTQKLSLHSLDPDITTQLATNIPFIAGPIMLEKEGYIKVRVLCGDQLLKVGTLRIRKATRPELQQKS